jgi:allophanate hydrolase
MRCTDRYTDACTNLNITESSLLTVADWRQAWLAGVDTLQLLRQRCARLTEAATPHVWISRADATALQVRLAALAAAAAGKTAQQCLQAWPLFGVPFAAKDNIDALGFDTTAACPAWAHTPARNASVVQRLLDAGAVLMGKTNLDQFATGLVGTRSPFGAPASALAPGRVSGGSSSGSAVAVARGEVAFSLGTDTAGSGRVPAAFNNLVGLKPTPGRVSTAGVLPACKSLDCVSVFAHTVDDAAAVLSVLEGADAADAYSAFTPGPAALGQPLRVGVPKQPQLDSSIGYDMAWAQALARLRDLGALVVEIDFEPLHSIARLLYEGPWVAERYLAVRSLIEHNPAAMDPTVAGIIGSARGFSAADAFAAQYTLRQAQQQAQALWQQVQLLMAPSAPRHPRFEEVAAQPVAANAALGVYTNFVNLLGWSALALPSGFTPQGLPFGVTFIGPANADAALARWGQQWQRAAALPLGATERRLDAAASSMPWPASEPSLRIAVVGAHLSGLPLNGQLTERGAVLECSTHTAPQYRLFELPNSQPAKPGLLRVAEGGHAIALELWRMPLAQVGSFLALIPPPLGLGSIELADGSRAHGFLCEAAALAGALDISHLGGWRAHLAQRNNHTASPGA